MCKKIFRAAFALYLVSFVMVACQKDLKETSLATQVHQDKKLSSPDDPNLLIDGLGVSFGSAIGPAGDLFVPDAQSGIIYRIDPETGSKTVFASGLPPMIPEIGLGGIMDVIFIGSTAYALVSVVDDPAFPTGQINGIYRITGEGSFEVIADLGAFNIAHPPTGFTYDAATGVLYAIEKYKGGFLVSDGHLNRVFYVSLAGDITILKQFGNIVPTGLDVKGNDIYMSQAGPVPHLSEHGKIVLFDSRSSNIKTIASGAPLVVDVEFGRGQTVFALSQGDYSGDPEGSPALPNTGSLVRANEDGTLFELADELDRPTSLEIIGNTAYVVTLEGEIWMVGNIAGPPFGH